MLEIKLSYLILSYLNMNIVKSAMKATTKRDITCTVEDHDEYVTVGRKGTVHIMKQKYRENIGLDYMQNVKKILNI